MPHNSSGKSRVSRVNRHLWLCVPLLMLTALAGCASGSSKAQQHTAPGVLGVGAGGPGIMTTNLFPGPPNCTWYAWQRVHNTEHIDLQARHNAGDWIKDIEALGAHAAWSEDTESWVPVELTTTPAVGDLVVVPHGDGVYAYGDEGHVAYVEQVLTSDAFVASAQDYYPARSTYQSTWSLSQLQHLQHGDARFIHLPTSPLAQRHSVTPGVTPTVTSTPTVANGNGGPQPPTVTPSPRPSPTPSPTPPPAPHWQSVLAQASPGCGNPGGVSWDFQTASAQNVITCTGSGLLMQQGSAYYPEANLTSAFGAYDANTQQVKVHVHFVNVNSSTYDGTDATIVVQTPSAANQCGGLLFEIRPNGQWRVQQASSSCALSIVASGTVGAASDYDMMVQVANGQMTGYLNGAPVVGIGDSLSGGVSGLMVIDFAWPTAQVYYTNFELDQYR